MTTTTTETATDRPLSMLDVVEFTEDHQDADGVIHAGETGPIVEVFPGDNFMVDMSPRNGELCLPVAHKSKLRLNTAFADM